MPPVTFSKRPAHHVFDRQPPASDCPARAAGFTLVELLAVITIIIVLVALTVPAMNAIKGGRDATKAAYDLAGALETARTYALANNTYVWVGFFEEDGGQSSANPAVSGNGGRIVVSIVASKDGTRYVNAVITLSPRNSRKGNDRTKFDFSPHNSAGCNGGKPMWRSHPACPDSTGA